jgi:hypothetical protein
MAARVQRRDGARPAMVAPLPWTEVGDKAETVVRLGQVGQEANWARWWWRVLLGMLSQ